MFNHIMGPDVRLASVGGDPYASNVILYLPMTDAITTSPYNGQAIPSGGNLNDYGVNSLGDSFIGADTFKITATPSSTGGTLAAGTYYIRVIAQDGANLTLWSSDIQAGITTTGSTSSIVLSWTPQPSTVTHRVYVSTSQIFTGSSVAYFTASTNSYTLTTISGGTLGTFPNRPETIMASVTSNSGTRTQNWGRFSAGVIDGGNNAGGRGYARKSPAIIFNHSSLNNICNTTGDFTIEFNVKLAGDGQGSGTYSTGAQNLKVFPFSFVGAATNAVTATVSSTLNPSPGGDVPSNGPDDVTQDISDTVVNIGDQMEMGMTIGSHTSPGGFGFGVGPADGTNRGFAAACTTTDSSPNSYVNRGFAAVPAGDSSTWGPYYVAVVRQSGVVSIFLNGKKINAVAGADEGGDGTQDSLSTWSWNTFKFDTLVSNGTGGAETNTGYSFGTGVEGNNQSRHGLFIGGSYTYSSYGADDDVYLQHFRVTEGVARYSADFTPETIYDVTP